MSCGKGGAKPVHRSDDVGPGLPVDDHQDGRLRVRIARVLHVLDGISYVGNIAETNRGAVVIGNEQRDVVDGFEDLVVGADFPYPLAIGEVAFGNIGICRRQGLAHLLQPDAILVQYHGVDFHAHARQGAPAHGHLAHAGDLRQFLRHDARGGIVDVTLVQHIGGQREHEDRRISRVHFPVCGIARKIAREIAAGCRYGRLHIARSGVDIAIEIKLQCDAA